VPPKTVSVFNSTTTQSFNWTAQVTNGANWISLSKSSGTASNVADTFQVTVNAVTVPNLGNNIGTIQVSTTAPFVNSVQNVVVNFNVLPDAGPVVAPESLTLFAKINSTATGQISIQRPATSPVTWTSVAVPLGVAAQLPAKLADGSAQLTPGGLVVDGALVAQPDWLTYNPTGGTTGATPTLIQVTVNPAAPSVNNVVGTYRAAIVIIPTNPYSPDWVRSVEVKMIVANQVYHLALPRVGR
jgi:hypothetical protein